MPGREKGMANSGRSIDTSEVHVIYADIRRCQFSSPEGLLSQEELERARKYRFEADSRRYVKARSMLRSVLASYTGSEPRNILFEYGKGRKPALRGEPADGLQFNVAHSGDMVAIGVSRGRRVGVDIEQIRETFPADVCTQFFTANETAALEKISGRDRAELFYRLWTRKEALLKATGLGLSGLPQSPDMLDTDNVTMQGDRWNVQDLHIVDGYKAALAVEGHAGEVKMLDWNND